MSHTLILGFGNVDRQDDGVAWHVLARLYERLGGSAPPSPDEDLELAVQSVDLLFVLQLTPELVETLAQYDRICFVDAHMGSVPGEVNVEAVEAIFQHSPLTHHMTPASCLALAQTLYGKTLQAILISVRGYEFGFARELSSQTACLVEPAVDEIVKWIGVV